MKEITIGKEKFFVYEEAKETTTAIWSEMNIYVFVSEWGVTPGEFAKRFFQYEKGFNESKMNEAYLTMVDMRRGADKMQYRFNPYEMIFALIVVDEQEKEDTQNYKKYISQEYLENKVERFRKLGLTNKQLASVVHDFTIASPESFPLDFLKTLERLIRWLHLTYNAR